MGLVGGDPQTSDVADVVLTAGKDPVAGDAKQRRLR